MTILKIFTPFGTLKRLPYAGLMFLYTLIANGTSALYTKQLQFLMNLTHIENVERFVLYEILPLIVCALLMALAVWSTLCCVHQRLNDLQANRTLILLVIVPLVNVIFGLYLLFAPSKALYPSEGQGEAIHAGGSKVFTIFGSLVMVVISALYVQTFVNVYQHLSPIVRVASRDTPEQSSSSKAVSKVATTTTPTKPTIPYETNTELLEGFRLYLPKMVKPTLDKATLTQEEATWCIAISIAYKEVVNKPLTDNAYTKVQTVIAEHDPVCTEDKIQPHSDYVNTALTPEINKLKQAGMDWLHHQYRTDNQVIVIQKLPAQQIKYLQTHLKEWGYPIGTPDGLFGKKTRQALLDFQNQQRIHANGQLTVGTLCLMGFTAEELGL